MFTGYASISEEINETTIINTSRMLEEPSSEAVILVSREGTTAYKKQDSFISRTEWEDRDPVSRNEWEDRANVFIIGNSIDHDSSEYDADWVTYWDIDIDKNYVLFLPGKNYEPSHDHEIKIRLFQHPTEIVSDRDIILNCPGGLKIRRDAPTAFPDLLLKNLHIRFTNEMNDMETYIFTRNMFGVITIQNTILEVLLPGDSTIQGDNGIFEFGCKRLIIRDSQLKFNYVREEGTMALPQLPGIFLKHSFSGSEDHADSSILIENSILDFNMDWGNQEYNMKQPLLIVAETKTCVFNNNTIKMAVNTAASYAGEYTPRVFQLNHMKSINRQGNNIMCIPGKANIEFYSDYHLANTKEPNYTCIIANETFHIQGDTNSHLYRFEAESSGYVFFSSHAIKSDNQIYDLNDILDVDDSSMIVVGQNIYSDPTIFAHFARHQTHIETSLVNGYHINLEAEKDLYLSAHRDMIILGDTLLQLHASGDAPLIISDFNSTGSALADVVYDTSSKELFYSTSRTDTKEKIHYKPLDTSIFQRMKVYRYKDKRTKKPGYGILLEDLDRDIQQNSDRKYLLSKDENNVLTNFNTRGFVFMLIESVAKLQREVKSLKEELQDIRNWIKFLNIK